jgi:phospholipid/cholesterol/gamma-HCH transport system permease protein
LSNRPTIDDSDPSPLVQAERHRPVWPSFEVRDVEGVPTLIPQGDWTVWTVASIEAELAPYLTCGADLTARGIDVSRLGQLDTAGAHTLWQLVAASQAHGITTIYGEHPTALRLLEEVVPHTHPPAPLIPDNRSIFVKLFDQIGRSMVSIGKETADTLDFVGRTVVALGKAVVNPGRLRWLPIVAVMESAGFNAIPIVATLSFFIGAVVAFMGATTLSQFGATVFTVELVGISVLREFGVLITAIIIAGRSDSAFTAQIGAMKMNQEIDAMATLGLNPMEMLVVPRVIALLVWLPILTLVAMFAGLIGGGVVAVLQLDMTPTYYLFRLQENVGVVHFWTGMAKAPVFAVIMAIIGCRQGLLVGNDVMSLGRNTTAAVVQAIFMVIVVDAIFAMVYLELDL